MIFYVDNKINKKKEFSYTELIKIFIANKEAYNAFLHGGLFENAFLNSMPGTPEPLLISSEDWIELYKEFKKQVPKPNYKF